MKKVIFTICAIVMMCIMTGCESESSNVRDGRELYELYLQKTLIAPDEMKIYGESYEENGIVVKWTVDVGGVTRGGHRFREKMKFETTGGGMIKVEDGVSYRLLSRGDVMRL